MRLPIVLWLLCSLSLLAADEKKPCVFCEIAAGRLDANRVVYRDETVVAFVNRAPRNPGHVLVVPIQHADGILDAPPATVRHLFEVAQVIAKAIQRTDLKAEGFVLKSSTGAVAGQTVFHLHLHGIPRFKGETPEPLPGQELPIAPAAELDAVAAKIRAALGSLNR